MVRGIFVMHTGKYGFALEKLLENIYIDDFVWGIGYVEAYSSYDRTGADKRFKEQLIEGRKFSKVIKEPPEYLLHLGEFKAFPGKADMVEIVTYQDFRNSNCQMIILIADSRFIDIYAKDIIVLEQIKKNAEKYDYEKTEYITDENDERLRMSII